MLSLVSAYPKFQETGLVPVPPPTLVGTARLPCLGQLQLVVAAFGTVAMQVAVLLTECYVKWWESFRKPLDQLLVSTGS